MAYQADSIWNILCHGNLSMEFLQALCKPLHVQDPQTVSHLDLPDQHAHLTQVL